MQTDNVQILQMNLVYLYYPSSMHHSQDSHLQPAVFNSSYCFLTLDFLSSSDQMLSLCANVVSLLIGNKKHRLKGINSKPNLGSALLCSTSDNELFLKK
jgi:hypothetical protein